ncbi:acyloxyacyl hydrolase [Vibrio sp. 10N]|uniref:acyloxyacyl hydrolase n=1 Tax=Vibrio sp. 10N TaxID=3058938 RepID=UPI00281322CE|nr:hypothetical protein VB10N_34860 [Vibrio sp. 10N]
MYRLSRFLLLSCCLSTTSQAGEILFGLGAGPQFGTDDHNQAAFVDAILYDYHRSSRQILSLGTSITHLRTNSASGSKQLTAFSIFPELRLSSTLGSKEVFFHVRALGPSYLTTTTFGEREQAVHFAFQAQVGGGIYLDKEKKYQLRFQYRHFSNANLKQPNDGIDVPFIASIGIKY